MGWDSAKRKAALAGRNCTGRQKNNYYSQYNGKQGNCQMRTERERWLEARKNGIGASDAACILGLNPWKSNVRLWEEKTGRVQAEDIGNKPAVAYGKSAEHHLRELFKLDFPQYRVEHSEFGMIANIEQYPWLFATLDGELTEFGSEKPMPLINSTGALEVKTTEIQRSTDWQKWDNQVPQYYYIQVLHQLLATQYDFVILLVQIKWRKNGEIFKTIRHYHFSANEQRESMQYLLENEVAFWASVQQDRRPPLILPPI